MLHDPVLFTAWERTGHAFVSVSQKRAADVGFHDLLIFAFGKHLLPISSTCKTHSPIQLDIVSQ
jgi:hypothetical protein